jgi:hypothetical protein
VVVVVVVVVTVVVGAAVVVAAVVVVAIVVDEASLPELVQAAPTRPSAIATRSIGRGDTFANMR